MVDADPPGQAGHQMSERRPVVLLGGIDEQHVVRILAILQHQDADWDTSGEEQIGGQANHRVYVPILEQ